MCVHLLHYDQMKVTINEFLFKKERDALLSSEQWKSHVDSQADQGEGEGSEGVHGDKDIAQVPASAVRSCQPRSHRQRDCLLKHTKFGSSALIIQAATDDGNGCIWQI